MIYLIYDFDFVDFLTISLIFTLKNLGKARIRYSASGKGLHIMSDQCLCLYECKGRAIARCSKQNEITFNKKHGNFASEWMDIEEFLKLNFDKILQMVNFLKMRNETWQKDNQGRKKSLRKSLFVQKKLSHAKERREKQLMSLFQLDGDLLKEDNR